LVLLRTRIPQTGSDAEAERAAHALASEVGEVRHSCPADAVPDEVTGEPAANGEPER
jgi:hypothetical protein